MAPKSQKRKTRQTSLLWSELRPMTKLGCPKFQKFKFFEKSPATLKTVTDFSAEAEPISVLHPDHPLMARFQNRLKTLLTERHTVSFFEIMNDVISDVIIAKLQIDVIFRKST